MVLVQEAILDTSKIDNISKIADIFTSYCANKNYHVNPIVGPNNLRLEISNGLTRPTIVNIYYKKRTIVVQGEQSSIKAEMEGLKQQIEDKPGKYDSNSIEDNQPGYTSYIILPQLRDKLKGSLNEIGDQITVTDKPDSAIEYRARVNKDKSTITITQYISGKLLLQGKAGTFFHNSCDYIERLINAPQKEVTARFIPCGGYNTEIINSHLSPGLIETSKNEMENKLGDAYNYLDIHDRKLIIASRCLCLSKIPLPEYSPLVMPASKAFEGYVKKLVIDLNIIPQSQSQKDKQIRFNVLIDNSVERSKICERGKYVDGQLRRLKESINANRHYMMHSEDSTLHTIDNPIHAEDKVNSICVDIKETYDYFKSIGLI